MIQSQLPPLLILLHKVILSKQVTAPMWVTQAQVPLTSYYRDRICRSTKRRDIEVGAAGNHANQHGHNRHDAGSL